MLEAPHTVGRWIIMLSYWLFYVIIFSGRGVGWQTGHAQSISLHQHVDTGLDVTLDPWPGVCRVSEGSPLLEEAVVCRRSGVRGQWRRGSSGQWRAAWAVQVPGCLYTVLRSILKVPMWVSRKPRVRLWNTWQEGTSQGVHFGHAQVHRHGNSSSNWSEKRLSSGTDLNLDDFIKENLWIFLELKLEILSRR